MILLRPWLGLPGLHGLLLGCVPVRQLLCLLLMLLLHLLGPGITSLLLSQALMLGVLLLLKALAFLVLPGNQSVLLLLVLFIRLCISGAYRLGTLNRGKVVWMGNGPGRIGVRLYWLRFDFGLGCRASV